MIAKIMKSSGGFQAVYYNEGKVSEQKATLMVAANFNQEGSIRGVGEMTKSDYITYFTALSQLNEKVKNRQFHAVISAKEQTYNAEELTAIAEEYLQRMGYGENPYLIYFHQDTNNNHVHLISTRVNREGVKVNDSFEKRESLRHIQNIMERTPEQEREEWNSTALVNRLLAYDFNSEVQLKTLIESQGKGGKKVEIDGKGDWHILQIKDERSRVVAKIDYERIQSKIAQSKNQREQEARTSRIKQLRAIFEKYKDRYKNKESIELFQAELKEKLGIELVFHKSKDHDTPFGYTIIDHTEKRIYKGSEVLKMKDFLNIEPKHTEKIKAISKAENTEGAVLDYLNDHNLSFVQKNGVLHVVDELNGDIYSMGNLSEMPKIRTMLDKEDGIYATNLDHVFDLKKEKQELGQNMENLLPSGGEEEDPIRKRKKQQGYGY